MIKNKSNKNENFARFLMVFIMIQPLLDLLTSFSLFNLNLSITPGIIIRFLIMIISAFYILLATKDKENRKYFYYLISMVVFFIIHLFVNFFVKETFNLTEELKSIAKIAYYVEMFFAFILAFKNLERTNKKDTFFPMNINIAVIIINIVMVVATLTTTGLRSYNGRYKTGHSGWFFAANELGTLLAIIFPIILWIALKEKNRYKKVLYWIQVVLTAFSLFAIGTKVGFLSVIIGIGLAFLGSILEWFIKRKKVSSKNYLLNLSVLVILIGVTTSVMPYLPAFTNTTAHLQALEDVKDTDDSSISEEEKNNKDKISEEENLFGEKEEKKESVLDGVVYSGRDGFLKMHQHFQSKAPISQEIFGMGYAGNYENSPKIIERDFHDIYFQFGWLGFILIIFPLIYFGIRILLVVVKDILKMISVKYVMIATSLVLGLGIAYLAGHTLSAPAVSTYFCLILAYLVVDLKVE